MAANTTRLVAVLAIGLLAWSATTPAGAARQTARVVTCPAGANPAVTNAFTTLFDRTQALTADQRAASLQRGDDPRVRAVLDMWLADPAGSSASVAVNDVACRRRTRAVVDADLSLAGTVLAEVLPVGHAVRSGDTWRVTTATFCTRVRLESPAYAERGACADSR